MLEPTPAQSSSHHLVRSKRLINSFVLANLCDAVATGVALSLPGFIEKGPLAGHMLADAQTIPLLILKTAITAFMVGIFALSTHRANRWAGPITTALRIATVLVWAVVAWNEFNILLAFGVMA